MSKKYPFDPAKYTDEIIRYTEIHLFDGDKKLAPILFAGLDNLNLKPGDKLDPKKHGEIIEELERAHFFLTEAKNALDKKKLDKYAESIRKKQVLSLTTAAILAQYLVDVYESKLKEAIEERGEEQLDQNSPLVIYEGTTEDGEPQYLITIKNHADAIIETLAKLVDDILDRIKKECGTDYWLEFAEWKWTHLIAWAMDEADQAGNNDVETFLFDEEIFLPNAHYLTQIYAQDTAQWLVDAIDVDGIDVDWLGELMGLPRVFKKPAEKGKPVTKEGAEIVALPVEVKTPLNPEYLPISAHAAAHAARRALAMGPKWKMDMETGEFWPMFNLTNRKGTVKGSAFMRPTDVDPTILYGPELKKWQARMLEYARKHLDDMAADVYDAIMAEWMDRAQYAEQMVTITLDRIMEYRALKPKTDEKGYRRGHQQKHKEAIARRVMALAGVFVKFDEVEVTEVDSKGKKRRVKWSGRGPLMQIDVEYTKKTEDGKQEVMGYHCRPGLPVAMGLFGPGRTTARLAKITLEMDPYRERYEKRLLRYFAYLWRVRQTNGDYNVPVKVATILEEIGLEVEKKNPARTKERLETALDRLKERGAITGWEYEGQADESIVGARGWADKWLEWRVSVEPPAFIMDHYREKINNPEPKRPALPAGELREAIREARKERGLTIAQAAEEIGISKSMLSMIENGRAKIGPRVRPKIEKWLNQ